MPYKDKNKARESALRSYKKHYKKNREKLLKRHVEWCKKIRLKVIDYYSNGYRVCACCGESILEFLTVDHINNDGTKQRKLYTGGGHHNYRFLIKNGFPAGYQILCYNCNCGRARRKDNICPHKKKENLNQI